MKIRTLVLLLAALGASAFASSRDAAASDLDVLAGWMTGWAPSPAAPWAAAAPATCAARRMPNPS